MRDVVSEIQNNNGVVFATYVRTSTMLPPYTNAEAAEFIRDEHHLNGNMGDYWSGAHPAFNKSHMYPLTAVITLRTGEVLATDPIPELLTPQEVLAAVEQANN